jgi:hypothetical protein
MKMEFSFQNTLSDGLKKYFDGAGIAPGKTSEADKIAKTKCGLQFINWVVNGSSKEKVVPPVLWGILRASGSVHVGNEFVGGNNLYPSKKGSESNDSDINSPADTITISFNTAYAAKLHETNWNPGPKSEQSGDTGNKYLEKHLAADGSAAIEMYARIFKKESKG